MKAAKVIPNAIHIQVPLHVREGEQFQVTPTKGEPFVVTVPKGYDPGNDITIIPPAAIHRLRDDKSDLVCEFSVNKTVAGAVIAGAITGSLLFGFAGTVILACAAGYSTTLHDSPASQTMKTIGDTTYRTTAACAEWVAEKMSISSEVVQS